MDRSAVALAVASTGILSAILFLVVVLALAPFARIWIEGAVLGMGPRLAAFRLGEGTLEIRALPLSSYAEPYGASFLADEPAEARREPPPGRVEWFAASPWRRALVFAVAPRLAALILAALVLGPARAGRAVVVGVAEIVRGAFGPLSTAREILHAGADVFAREGFVVLAALALSKWISFGMLSLPTDFAYATSRAFNKPLAVARAILLLVLLALYVPWIIGWIAWAMRA